MLPKDPFILLSLVNTKLRDGCENLSELCAALDADETEIRDTLAALGCRYDPDANQFKLI